MAQIIDGVYVESLRQVTKLKAKRLKGGSWRKLETDKVIQGAGTQPLHTYLDSIQATVAE